MPRRWRRRRTERAAGRCARQRDVLQAREPLGRPFASAIGLTDAGRKALVECQQRAKTLETLTLAGFTPDEQHALREFLERCIRNLDAQTTGRAAAVADD